MSASEYPIVKNFLIFEEVGSDCIGIDYRAGEIDWTTRKANKHNLVTEVYPFLANNPNIWKRINILLEGVKKSNIPKLYSPEKIIHEEDHSYLIYPLIKGKSFEQVLDDSHEKDNPINFDLAFSIALSIADLIDVGSSIVVSGEKSFHGFLTPDNIIIDYDGKIYLKNYGIYPYLSKEEDIFNEIVKKYGAWIAPEFFRKEKLVCQTDIYHLGYIIYKILTGKYFSCSPEEDFDSKFSNISFTQHIPSSDKSFLTDIISFFKKTLHPQPSQRFANIKEFKDFISNRFHIEELSSVTFNLSYFMNTLYLDSMENTNEVMEKELAYTIPEVKKEEKVAAAPAKGSDTIVQDILSGLDEHDRKASKSKLIIPIAAVIVVIVAVVAYLYISSQQKLLKEQEKRQAALLAQVQKDAEAQRLNQQKEFEEKMKAIQTQVVTTEEEKKAQQDKMNQLIEWQKAEEKKAEDKRKQDEERIAKAKLDEENLKKLEAEREQERLAAKQKEDELKKQEQAKLETIKKEEEKNRIKPGQLLALTEVTVKPNKIKGKNPSFNLMLKKKYQGNKWSVQVILLVMENGSVGNVRMLSKIPDDVKEEIITTLGEWQYEPAQKDGIKVKVWLPVNLSIII